MRRALLLAVLLVGCGRHPPAPAPSLIFHHGKVFTADPAKPWAQALAVSGGSLTAVGSDAEVLALAGSSTSVVDLQGRTVTPGIVDAHSHVAPLGAPAWFVNAPDFVARGEPGPDASEVVRLVSERAASAPVGTPILAIVGPAYYATAGGNPRQLLDAATTRHPVITVDWTGHGLSLNSVALAGAGYVDGQPNPYGGRLSRDGGGALTGYAQELAEVAVFRFLSALLPTEAYVSAYSAYGRAALALGYTEVVDIPFVLDGARASEVIGRQDSGLDFVPVCLLDAPGKKCPAGADGVIRRKLFMDGGPSDCSTYVSIPYRAPETCPAAGAGWVGFRDLTDDELGAALGDVLERGGQLLVHALGDAAVSELFDRMEALAPAWQGRVTLEHGDMIRPGDVDRARRLGVAIVQNPVHLAVVPPLFALRYEPALYAEAQPLRSLEAAGIPLAFGSDTFGVPTSPWVDVLLASTHPAHPSEALSREEAVVAYTRAAAAVRELAPAVLAPGNAATLAVLSQDVFTVPPQQLASTASVVTMVRGRVAWDDGSVAPPGGWPAP